LSTTVTLVEPFEMNIMAVALAWFAVTRTVARAPAKTATNLDTLTELPRIDASRGKGYFVLA
jgi:hypothetical protein